MERTLAKCPICQAALHVAELACKSCETTFRGAFSRCAFCALAAEHREFVELFLRHRGNLSSVGGELGLSYPTVAKRLDAALAALGVSIPDGGAVPDPAPDASPAYAPQPPPAPAPPAPPVPNGKDAARRKILEMLDRGEIDADDATRRLREL